MTSRTASPRRYVPETGKQQKLIIYVIALGSVLTIPVGPGVSATVLILATLSPVLAAFIWRSDSQTRLIAVAAIFWFGSQIMSNLLNGSGLTGMFREELYPAILLLGFAGSAWIRQREDSATPWLLMLGGTALAGLWSVHSTDPVFAWKFALAEPVTLAVVIGFAAKSTRGRVSTLLFIVAMLVITAVSLAANARNAAGIAFLGVLAALPLLSAAPTREIFSKRFRIAFGATVALFACLILFAPVQLLGALPFVNQQATARTVEQFNNPGGVILGARPEIVVSTAVALSSPIVGLGGHPEPDGKVMAGALNELSKLKLPAGPSWYTRGGVNSHSLLFHFWITAGLGGLIFWCIAIIAMVMGARRRLRDVSPGAVLAVVVLASFLWDVFYSPWITNSEILLGIMMAALVTHDRGSANA
jgi:hypothetical protein